jgi:hypothetical protein
MNCKIAEKYEIGFIDDYLLKYRYAPLQGKRDPMKLINAHRKTIEYLCSKVGCSSTSLWRYSRKVDCFITAPLNVVAGVFRMANVSNEDLRYILGLPYGKEK